ncbi:MAG: MBOAT family protein [Pseudomonadota bacterium]|nr:MBOAT family protein [Pseudomonadota bacterium]
MSFVDKEFAYFLPVVFVLWLATRGRYRLKVAVMLAASLVFYGHNRWWMLGIIVAYCLVDWATGLWLQTTRRPRLALALGVGFNLTVLCFWKYTPLLVQTVAGLLGWPDLQLGAGLAESWVVPMGISFYAFAGIAYMVDVYRGLIPAEPSLLRYSLFTAFFPHLVAGPILRAREFLVDLRPGALPERPLDPLEGSFLIARGYLKKAVLADGIAGVIDPFFANVSHPSTAGVWALPYVYLYALQIYFDFSGYTDIARGLGLWFGFRWPENFNWPYLATSIQDFWRRWHMTLSRFLRDYLYIPLGGNRSGPWRASLNLMITMLLGGLWHGASWSFVLWGGLHGLFLVINRLWGETRLQAHLSQLTGLGGLAWTGFRIVLTFHAVCLAWCFFRLTNLSDSLACVRKWVDFDLDKAFVGGSADSALWLLLATYGLASAAAALLARGAPLSEVAQRVGAMPFARGALWGSALSLFALALLLAPGGRSTPFIYFQF